MDFFLQHWHTVGAFTGRDLGPNLFQFKFESEHDLQSILSKAPYHFKKWMIILQRWEPIVSDQFPAFIPFWISIHGIPLHFWTEQTITTIGEELGHVELKDVSRGRIRVLVNGLKPLEMGMEVELAGDTKYVEFEYEKLEKHCFSCFSLSHEHSDCPNQRSRASQSSLKGISQARTMERLDDYRRRQDERRPLRHSSRGDTRGEVRDLRDRNGRYPTPSVEFGAAGQHRNPRPTRDVTGDRRLISEDKEGNRSSLRPTSRPPSNPNKTPHSDHSDRSLASRPQSGSQRSVWRRISGMANQENPTGSLQSQVSHTPPPAPHREPMSPIPQRPLSGGRALTNERDERSGERRSALERLSGLAERTPLLFNGVANSESGRLQEVDIQYIDEAISPHLLGSFSRPSTSKAPANNSPILANFTPSSPIRTLSEDRRHVTLRLGPYPSTDSPENEQLALTTKKQTPAAAAKAKAAGKKKVTKPATRKRVVKNPSQGTTSKRRKLTNVYGSPAKKLMAGAIAVGTQGAKPKVGTQPKPKVFPSSSKGGPDFRPTPSSLP